MGTEQLPESNEEFAKRGDEIYQRQIRGKVEQGNRGRIVAIDLETGAYEMGEDELAAISATLARTSRETSAPARHAPRSLKTRTISPVRMPRLSASSVFSVIFSRPDTLAAPECAEGSSWLCKRLVGCMVTRCSGQRAALSAPSHSTGGSQLGCGGHSSRHPMDFSALR